MSYFKALKKESIGRDERERTHELKRNMGKNIPPGSRVAEVGGRLLPKERLPLLGSSRTKATERLVVQRPPQAWRKKRVHPPISAAPSDTVAPWEGSFNSESSFIIIPSPPPPPPRTPLPIMSIDPLSLRPQPIKATQPENGQNIRAKRRPLPPRRPIRPPCLPPLRQITNLSFTRSFTFSFFELPHHQSARSQAERLRNVAVLLRQIKY